MTPQNGQTHFKNLAALAKKEWETQQKNEKEQIKLGYTRLYEKIKEIRQHFSRAVTSGCRSGSGKMVLEFYDELVQIWCASPLTEPLRCSTSSESVSSTQNESDIKDDDDDDGEEEINWNRNSGQGTSTFTQSATGSKKMSGKMNFSEQSPVPRLIVNRRRHLERQSSTTEKTRHSSRKQKKMPTFVKI